MTVEVRRPRPSKQKARIALWTYSLAKPRGFFVCFGQHVNKPKSVTSRLESLSEQDEEFTLRKFRQPYCAAFPPKKTLLPGLLANELDLGAAMT
jgi:hypothetical protein